MTRSNSVLVITLSAVAAVLLTYAVQDGVLVQRAEFQPAAPENDPAITAHRVLPQADPVDRKDVMTFRGASVDGYLRTDHRGQLVVDIQLRHWMDFYLSAQGEVPLDDLLQTMRSQIAALPEPGQSQALKIMDEYLGYLAALGDYDRDAEKRISQSGMDELAARVAWQQRLRREWLEPEVVEAFFHADEIMDNYTLARQQLRAQGADETQLAALESSLPPELQQLRQQSQQVLTLQQQEQQLRQQGASAEAVQQWREQQYGKEAAERLASVDKQQQQWQQRLTDYQQYRDSLALQGLDNQDREMLLRTYRSRHFSDAEQKRLNAALTLLAGE
ncbi:lipase secretion chaperone [Thalassolituus hydrocarboniclasticus]|uniref:Lipase chaperone n=1 Tax=Thalassolituus hydrocarboniclasticus TaxID=2742796 RepID=A0ABY6ACP6_9GAMM|nr:lipase secretion chaperone [Thalassolituus hydrocarboniclasticus]UXD88806.1 hypothetical protein HUF19_15775 [Thalassolituus hydrocarboniclasticus]